MNAQEPLFVMHKEESFFLNNFNIDLIFNTIERADYLYLHYIKACSQNTAEGGKVYLSTISEVMHIPIPNLSKAIEKLQDKGLVIWKTDNTVGKTYVELSSKATELMEAERGRMAEAYRQIREEVSEGELLQMTRTMKRVTAILKRTAHLYEDLTP